MSGGYQPPAGQSGPPQPPPHPQHGAPPPPAAGGFGPPPGGGGFGAPGGQGGYGGQPPGGYGPPPPAGPANPGGYGAAPPPPGGYGGPPGMPPGGQPGYPGGLPPVPPGGGRKRSPWPAILAVVLVLGLAGGGWFLLGPSDDDGGGDARPPAVSPDTPGGQVWSVAEEVDDGARPNGFWVVGETVVKSVEQRFTAYSVADGSEVWSLELPDTEHVCAPTTDNGEGVIVVGHGDSNCGQNITQIDLTTGEQGWSRPLDPEDNPLSFQIAMAGPSYAIHTLGGWNLHRVADGELIHAAGALYDSLNQDVNQTDFANEHQLVDGEELCSVDAVAGGEKLIRRRTCATVTSAASGSITEPVFRIEEIDPASGDTLWSMDLPEGRWLSNVHSVSPLIVSLRGEQFGTTNELAFIDQGVITAQLPFDQLGVGADDLHLVREGVCRGDVVSYHRVDDCGGMAVVGERVYFSPAGSIAVGTPVTAVDVTTGAVEWIHQTEDFADQTVLAADENGVIVHQTGFGDEPGQVIRLSADGQTVEPLFRTEGLYVSATNFNAFLGDHFVFSQADYSFDFDLASYGADGQSTGGTADPAEEDPAAEDPAAEASGGGETDGAAVP
ncbi:PQQ-binding-like beta-propeller repeat protein [Streptomyces sp. DSM 44915]|uniref:PQQ-binding-like beta-propeller repeat protein n=1 Tax=Streptomyces chisholmiae TaxID=3075540 RepID=A0ABU2JQ97_9ACTN|nr:PQQ-binding-like beta-propeller repeat protein [Streptomyces sp. DSM 44915]MDT0266689.1 PQQ-binding-like beta-propeller repeat protein [Streptomyces sp. DSM 44915]